MTKRTVQLQLSLSNKGAIKFDGEGGGQIRFDFDTSQTAVVAELLLAGETLIDAALVFAPSESNDDKHVQRLNP